jgi:proline iminopeptidase
MLARIRDTEIYFDIDGAALVPDGPQMRERPIAFLIHGGPGSDHSGLKSRYGALATRMQLVYFDLRGHGRSARGDAQRYTLDENVEDMEALRRYLGLGPIVTLGTSYGGMVAMAHAARYPDSVSHLILVATVAHGASIARTIELVRQHGTAAQYELCKALFTGQLATAEMLHRYYDVVGPLYSRKSDLAISPDGIRRSIATPEALVRAHGPTGYMRELDLRPELRRITARTLILAGRHDYFCAPEFSEEILRLIPASDLRVFEESGHTIAGDEPQKLFDAIAGFLAYNTHPV